MTATLTWWGHSTSTWQDGDTTVLFDPVLTARLGHLRRVRGPVPRPHAAHADLVLISHLHADHAHLPSLRLIPASAVLIVPAGSRRLFKPVTARGVALSEVEPGDLVRVRRSTDTRPRSRPRWPATPWKPSSRTRARLSGRGKPPVLVSRGHGSAHRTRRSGTRRPRASASRRMGAYPWARPSRCPASGSGDLQHAPSQCSTRALGNLVAHRPSPTPRSDRSARRGVRRPSRSSRAEHPRPCSPTRPVGQAVEVRRGSAMHPQMTNQHCGVPPI